MWTGRRMGSEHTRRGQLAYKMSESKLQLLPVFRSPSLLFPGQPAWCLKFSKTTIGLDESSFSPTWNVSLLPARAPVYIDFSHLSFSKNRKACVFFWHRWMCQNRQHWAKSSGNGAQDRCILMVRKISGEVLAKARSIRPCPLGWILIELKASRDQHQTLGIPGSGAETTEGDEAKMWRTFVYRGDLNI